MGRYNFLNESFESDVKRNHKSQIISFLILFLIIIGYSLWRSHGSDSLKMQWTEEALTITDPSGGTYSLQLENINSISYQSDWNFGDCPESKENHFYRYGRCENDTVGKYQLYASKNCSSVILIRTDTETTAVSYESDTTTKQLYEALPHTFEEFGINNNSIFR